MSEKKTVVGLEGMDKDMGSLPRTYKARTSKQTWVLKG